MYIASRPPVLVPPLKQDAFRHLHPQAREFTHTATSGSSSARIDRWLVTDSLLPDISAATVSDLRPSDHYRVSLERSVNLPSYCTPTWPGRMGNATQHRHTPCLQDPHDSSDPSLHVSVPTLRSCQQGSRVGPAEDSHSRRC